MNLAPMTQTMQKDRVNLVHNDDFPHMQPFSQAPLTRREREAATLAAQGITNAQLAAHLFVSERTVESHLYAAFRKLGITRRDQLADALRDESIKQAALAEAVAPPSPPVKPN
jgi:DNA-binding CsgD family transcriptional regulator